MNLDVVYDATAERWTGAWTGPDGPGAVTLERPHASREATANAFVGMWDGVPDPDPVLSVETYRLHIAQSADGWLTVWLDTHFDPSRFRDPIPYDRYGELLRLISIDPPSIVIDKSSPTDLGFTFTGTLSADGQQIVGEWTSNYPPRDPRDSRSTPASARFDRMTPK